MENTKLLCLSTKMLKLRSKDPPYSTYPVVRTLEDSTALPATLHL